MSVIEVNTFSIVHEISLYLSALLTIFLHLFLRGNKQRYSLTINLFLLLNFLLFLEGLVFVPEDPFRMIWFYILVYLAFVFKSNKAGIFYTFLSILTIIFYELLAEKPDPQIAINSATVGLIVMSSIFHVYTKKFIQYHQSLEEDRLNLKRLATTDSLTQTMNRHFFTQLSDDLFSVAQSKKSGLVLILMDLDFFKNINDTYGHHIGDNVLIHITKVIKQTINTSMTLARVGGEEFALLSDTISIDEAKVLAESIREKIEQEPYNYKEHKIKITISIGIASYHQGDSSFSEIFIRADNALYQAKDEGRNTIRYSN